MSPPIITLFLILILYLKEISKIKPVSEQRVAAVDKVELMLSERKVTPNFTLQTRRKVNDTELADARGGLKKVGGVEEMEGKLTKINQEVGLFCNAFEFKPLIFTILQNYRRMKELSAKPEEVEFLQQKPKKDNMVEKFGNVPSSSSPSTSSPKPSLPVDDMDDSDSDGSLVEMLQSIIVC